MSKIILSIAIVFTLLSTAETRAQNQEASLIAQRCAKMCNKENRFKAKSEQEKELLIECITYKACIGDNKRHPIASRNRTPLQNFNGPNSQTRG